MGLMDLIGKEQRRGRGDLVASDGTTRATLELHGQSLLVCRLLRSCMQLVVLGRVPGFVDQDIIRNNLIGRPLFGINNCSKVGGLWPATCDLLAVALI